MFKYKKSLNELFLFGFVRLEVGSVKVALSYPAHQRVTPAVGRLGREGLIS